MGYDFLYLTQIARCVIVKQRRGLRSKLRTKICSEVASSDIQIGIRWEHFQTILENDLSA